MCLTLIGIYSSAFAAGPSSSPVRLVASETSTRAESDDDFSDLEELAALWSIADEGYRAITLPLDRPAFVHQKVITLETNSLTGGWVHNYQCHRYFPLFPALQISFREGTVRNMNIVNIEAADEAYVDEPTIQMKRTRLETRLCFTSENRIVTYDKVNDEYRMSIGPYYLKLFDGYFPLDVHLTIDYPAAKMKYLGVEPAEVDGAEFEYQPGKILFSALFEGKLALVFRFTPL